MRAKEYTPREFVRLLKANGYTYNRSNGDHDIYVNADNGRTISFKSTDINRMIAKRLIKEHKLKVD